MPTETARAGADHTNLGLLLGLAVLGLAVWWWVSFSGPFRWLIDLELRQFGDYREWPAAITLAIAALALAWVATALPRWILPGAWAARSLVALLLVLDSLAGLAQAWTLWNQAGRMPSRTDPAQRVDLDQLGGRAPPTGHLRLIGVPDRARQVLIQSPRGRGARYWDSYVPVTGRRQPDPAAPLRIVASHRQAEGSSAKGLPEDPDGVLLPIDTRTLYQLRQQGLPLADPAFVLFWPGDDVNLDTYVEAVLLGLPILLFWPFAAYRHLTGQDSRQGPRPADPPVPAPVSYSVSYPGPALPPADARTPRSRFLFRLAMVFALAAMLVAGVAVFTPDMITELAFYGVAGAIGLVALLLVALSGRGDTAAAPLEAAPLPGSALLYVMRHQPVSSSSFYRVDLDGVRVAVLKANRFTAVALRPGAHRLAVNVRVSLPSDTVERFEAAAGEVVIYQLHVPLFGRPSLERITDLEAGRQRLARLKRVPAA